MSTLQSRPQPLEEALLRAFIWAYAGGIFGAVFLGLERLIGLLQWPLPPQVPAAALAGGVSALFYGSMRLAVLATLAATLSALGYLVLMEPPIHPLILAGTAGMAGAILGGAYGLSVEGSRVFRADAKTLAGLTGGLAAAVVMAVLLLLVGDLPLWLTTAILCPVTGLVYVTLASQFARRFQHLMPPLGDGILVGVGVGSCVGLAIWVVAGGFHAQLVGPFADITRDLVERAPAACGGAILGAALAGFIGGLLGRDWPD
jgi:hypothetical protein